MKNFESFFISFPASNTLRTSPLLRVQKYASFSLMQAFSLCFFDVFSTFPVTRWNASTWRRKFFYLFLKHPVFRETGGYCGVCFAMQGIEGHLGSAFFCRLSAQYWSRSFLGCGKASPSAPIGGRELLPPGFGWKTAAESGNCVAWKKKGLSLPGENYTVYKEGFLWIAVLGIRAGVAAQIKDSPVGCLYGKLSLIYNRYYVLAFDAILSFQDFASS
jgi:hypothetical protein